ncbi:hypothetical protein ACOJBM_01115 [Rhizobium beringeri]
MLLERDGIRATVTGEKGDVFKIAVDETDHARAIELLSDAGLPRLPHRTMADLFPGDGFLVTPLEQKARMTYAVEQQLGETLSALDGVAAARVHIVLPEDNGRGLIKEKARASALLQYRPGANLVDIEMKSRSLAAQQRSGSRLRRCIGGGQPLVGDRLSLEPRPPAQPNPSNCPPRRSRSQLQRTGWPPFWIIALFDRRLSLAGDCRQSHSSPPATEGKLMTRAGSHGEQAALEDVAVRRAALAGAGCGAGWLSEIDADLLRHLDATPRLQSRLFHARAETGGDPACLPVEAGHLLTLSPRMQREAALSVGLTYHLAAAGPVLSKDKVAALTAIFGEDALVFACGHAHLSPSAPTLPGFEDEEVRRFAEAGWLGHSRFLARRQRVGADLA